MREREKGRTTAFILHGQKPFYADLNPHLFNQAALAQTHINFLSLLAAQKSPGEQPADFSSYRFNSLRGKITIQTTS
jgi:hypothetical protein